MLYLADLTTTTVGELKCTNCLVLSYLFKSDLKDHSITEHKRGRGFWEEILHRTDRGSRL